MLRSNSSSSKITIIHSVFLKFFSTIPNNLPSITKSVPYKYRSRAVKQAQEVLTDYFHNTRGLPYPYAENISKHSTYSLYDIVSKLPFSVESFKMTFWKFLRYNPIDEFGFFYESIGIDYGKVSSFLKPNIHFFSDDSVVLDVACYLAGFGFPWDKLGKLYVEEDLIFRKEIGFLNGRLNGLVSLGFGNQQVVGICLAFPGLLKGEEFEFGSEFEGLLSDLKRVFIDFDLGNCMVGNVDVWYDVSSKVKVFYELGVAEGEVGQLIGNSESIFTEYSKEVLAEKVEFFSRLGVEKSKVGVLILLNPMILSIKINDRVISVSSILEHFEICEKKLLSVKQNFKYVFGRNKMINLPHILKAMNLHEWFFHRMECGYYNLFDSYDLSSSDDGVDESYVSKLESINSGRLHKYASSKLDFFRRIGFGENSFTLKVLEFAHGSPRDLQKRFDFLLSNGIEFCNLCKMISRQHNLLCHDSDSIKKKLDFFTEETGLPSDYLETFPGYLTYSLEKRIKPRYKFIEWLTEQGLCSKKYTLATIISSSDKAFLKQLSCIHPDALQLWLEKYGNIK